MFGEFMDYLKIRSVEKNAKRQNENNRGVFRYKCRTHDIFAGHVQNTLITGGAQHIRHALISAAAGSAISRGIPVLVIHASDKSLLNKFYHDYGNFIDIGPNSAPYEPFKGMSDIEISQLIAMSSEKGSEIGSTGMIYLEGISNLIRSKGTAPSCDMYIRCPHGTIIDQVNNTLNKGLITVDNANKIASKLVRGQNEVNNIEMFFRNLDIQGNRMIADRSNYHMAYSVKDIVNRGVLGAIDVGRYSNNLLTKLILNESLMSLMSGTNNLMIILDDPRGAHKDGGLMDFIISSTPGCKMVISSDDIYADLKSDQNLFSTVVAMAEKVMIMSHSGVTCNKLSEIIGQYDKTETNHSYTRSTGFFAKDGPKDCINISHKREYRVNPEDISRLSINELFLLDRYNPDNILKVYLEN